ncbi:Dip5p [Sugiyamaella lignohabitans]|uniref:Dip5p n=1 Tax=Sugiyamaella lignohabitans TaxID=796027 RepID=A0A167EXL1_9ASCO|nr:Dip5p [Sugiyamaella lignohabitans]ANB14576.1 Dip5p [Sugiyamaella lignohabitans]
MSEDYGNEKNFKVTIYDDSASDEITVGVFKEDKTRLTKGLKQRHIQMIALVGVIGTGLFLYSGGALQSAGPLGMLLAYLLVGTIVGFNQIAVAEVSAFMPTTGSTIRQLEHFIDPAFGFAFGYLQFWWAVIPSEFVAASVVVSYWSDLNPAIWLTIFIVLAILANSWSIRLYGEIEFFFACLKILLILGLILTGLIIDLGGVKGQPRLGFHYWKHPGVWAEFMKTGAAGRTIGFFSVMNGAVYSFGGLQTVALLAGETQNPRRNIPKAAKRILARVLTFYMLALFIVSLIVPYDNPDISNGSGNASGSPFVVAMKLAGIKVLPSIVNAMVLCSAWSAASGSLVQGSRILFSLAANNQAPKVFLRTNKRGLPWVGLIVTGLFLPLSYMSLSSSSSKVFGYLVNVTSSIILIQWILIASIHFKMNKALDIQGHSRHELPYHFKGGRYLGIISGIGSLLLLLIGGFTIFISWSTSQFVSAYVSIPLFLAFSLFWKLYKKTKWVEADKVDLKSLFLEIENNPEPEEVPLRGWHRLEFLWA